MAANTGRARTLMIQGTMSNVGKSLLVAGIVRALAREGLSVAPFKSQNMALNSGVTPEGLEMGRAQVLQAQAAGIVPDVRMNPILLKPSSDIGSQVIVKGKPQGVMRAREYFSCRHQLLDVVRASFESLASEHDLIVIEGAGSPAEINLGPDELVNMGMAHMAHSPVLLVGDIDPGGVFAQLYGTMQLLSEQDRPLVRGLIVNKFRGDATLFEPGRRQLEELCGVPVVGVVPYAKLDLDDEDSLSSRLDVHAKGGVIDIAVIRLPHLSNFTDFNQLSRHPQASVRYVTSAEELARPDLVVLPGTKSTIDDLLWLKESGLEACIHALAGCRTPILGICGGYQMLGGMLSDPHGVEGMAGRSVPGLALLPTETIFEESKVLGETHATMPAPGESVFSALSQLDLTGYEIHMGQTTVHTFPGTPQHVSKETGELVAMSSSDGRPIGHASGDVMGTYLHGLFDAAGAVEAIVDALLMKRGLAASGACLTPYDVYREEQLDHLADIVASSLDMSLLHAIIDQGIE